MNSYQGIAIVKWDTITAPPEPPPQDHVLRVTIRRNSDGVTVIRHLPWWAWDSDRGGDYYWSEGNMACDCNRELEFRRGGGEPWDLDDVTCGAGSYSITSITQDDDPTVLYEETP